MSVFLNCFLSMRYFYIFSAMACLLSLRLSAQDIVYLNDQTSVSGTLADLTPDKVSLRVVKGESTIRFSYGADRVAAVVNRRGRFLCLAPLQTMAAADRDRLISQFLNTTDAPAHDLIIRAIPAEVIPCKISYAQGDVVNYTTLDGAASSLPKTDLVGIMYQNGTHELFADASFLCDKIALLPTSVPPALAGSAPEPVAQATPEPAVQPVAEPKSVAVTTTDQSADAVSPTPRAGKAGVLDMTEDEYGQYRMQGLERVQEFAVLLGVIADKATDVSQKDKAISQVLKMFRPDATVQVSSMVRGGQANTYRVKDYLIRLKLLPYKRVTLEWGDIQYVQELTRQDDGNYHGKIRGEQRFSGLSTAGDVQYGDVTQKDVDVIVTPYKKRKDGDDLARWDVLLGNVGVVATQ